MNIKSNQAMIEKEICFSIYSSFAVRHTRELIPRLNFRTGFSKITFLLRNYISLSESYGLAISKLWKLEAEIKHLKQRLESEQWIANKYHNTLASTQVDLEELRAEKRAEKMEDVA